MLERVEVCHPPRKGETIWREAEISYILLCIAIYYGSSCMEANLSQARGEMLPSVSSLKPLQPYVSFIPGSDGGEDSRMVPLLPDKSGTARLGTASNMVGGWGLLKAPKLCVSLVIPLQSTSGAVTVCPGFLMGSSPPDLAAVGGKGTTLLMSVGDVVFGSGRFLIQNEPNPQLGIKIQVC